MSAVPTWARRWLPWIALGALVGLLAYAVTPRGPRLSDGLAEPGSCEAQCLDREPACAGYFTDQGGFPPADWTPADRLARCNGLCLLLRRTHEPGDDCLR